MASARAASAANTSDSVLESGAGAVRVWFVRSFVRERGLPATSSPLLGVDFGARDEPSRDDSGSEGLRSSIAGACPAASRSNWFVRLPESRDAVGSTA